MPDLLVTRRLRPSAALLVAAAAAGSVACASHSARNAAAWKDQNSYGSEMARKGFWREALFRYEKAAALHPDNPEVQNNLGVAYESIGETSRALSAYKRALELAPQDAKIKRNYARFAEYYTSVQRASSLPAPASGAAVRPSPAPAPASTPATTPEKDGTSGSSEPPLLPPSVGIVPAETSPGSPVPAPAQNPPSAPQAPTPGQGGSPPGGG
jgi:hypothetical protein